MVIFSLAINENIVQCYEKKGMTPEKNEEHWLRDIF